MDAKALILGGGPAGLTAAHQIQSLGVPLRPVVFEADAILGGIARTESKNGYRFDIGGHRFFTKVPEVEALWHEILGDEFLTRPRASRIFYRGRYYDYPLKPWNALSNIGPYEATRIVLSYLKWQVRSKNDEKSFEDWVINRFGGRLYMHFFRSYTEKVWGIPPSEIGAEWAAQRIKNLSLRTAVWNAFTGGGDATSLIEEFQYPRLGPGMMWERCGEIVAARGGEVHRDTRVGRIARDGARVEGVEVTGPDGARFEEGAETVSTLDLRTLIHAFDPPPPPEVVAAADALRYRDFLIVTLVLDHPDPFPDNWIYIHERSVKVGRIQNFRAWSPDMVPDAKTAGIGMEYFCHEGDGLWSMSDADLTALAAQELETLGLAKADTVIDSFVIRQPKAYPVYDAGYRDAVATIADWVRGLENLQTVGRNGLHRYNNQDHSMLTAMLAARNLAGEDHDVWTVNVERAYHETFTREDAEKAA